MYSQSAQRAPLLSLPFSPRNPLNMYSLAETTMIIVVIFNVRFTLNAKQKLPF